MKVDMKGYETLSKWEPMDVFEFVEPHVTGGVSTVSLYVYDILRYMDVVYAARNDGGGELVLPTDDELVEDFCANHSAEQVKDPVTLASIVRKIWWGERGPY